MLERAEITLQWQCSLQFQQARLHKRFRTRHDLLPIKDITYPLSLNITFISQPLPPRPPQPPKPPLPQLPPRRPIHKHPLPLTRRAPTTRLFRPRLVPHIPQQHRHHPRTHYRQTQNPHHHQRALPILASPLFRIARPTREKRIRRQYASQIPETRHERRGGGDADLAVARLEDFRGPGHGDGDGGAETETDEEEAAVAGPGVGGAAGVGGHEESGDLDADGDGEEEGAVVVEAVGEGGY